DQIALSAKLANLAKASPLGKVRDALAILQLAAASRCMQRAFLPDAPLADYLRGVYAWLFAVVRALEQLTTDLAAGQPDWVTFHWRIEEAKNFHFDELEGDVLHDLLALREAGADAEVVAGVVAAYDKVLAEARALEHLLEERSF
ncbi:MAG: hypothetical protein K0S65_6203, partial [Labilithrix sp.]|nr:hypothetical protein [Labilithrix sp.]